MRIILVVERKHLFPRLSPSGFLPPDSVDLEALAPHLFFAERDFMEQNSHYKQIIPYMILQRGRGQEARLLAYQRRLKHSEARLGGLWSIGFGGHIEPLDRTNQEVATIGLVRAAAMRELTEETGLDLGGDEMRPMGYINSDQEDVSSVHFGVVFPIELDDHPGSDEEILQLVSRQAEPHQARWLAVRDLPALIDPGAGPDGGTFEDWSRITIGGVFATASAAEG